MPDDDPPWWNRFMTEFPGEVKLDTDCAIFMNAGSHIEEGMWERVLEIVTDPNRLNPPDRPRVLNRLLMNTFTDEQAALGFAWPCILHFNGGSSDALTGKWESIKPYWQALGHTELPPWEGK
jgi:hypothetical protein